MDISGEQGQNLLAIMDGVIVDEIMAGYNGGNKIVIEITVNGTKFYAIYFHVTNQSLSEKLVGTKIEKGSVIGGMGNTGTSGTHLHFEIRTANGVNVDSSGNYVSFPNDADSFWANSQDELETNRIDISRNFYGYSSIFPESWSK